MQWCGKMAELDGACLRRLSKRRNEVTSTADQHYKSTDTSSSTRGHQTILLRVKGDIEDVSSELDNTGSAADLRHPEGPFPVAGRMYNEILKGAAPDPRVERGRANGDDSLNFLVSGHRRTLFSQTTV
ncbi:hypothetical protein TNCV_454861 [Trichonephila clavipes]|nr:hypothetical protein TNCV_454861 [Trichonephila clavipes]